MASLLSYADQVHTKHWSDGSIYYIYEWNHIKWYESHLDVKACIDWMNNREAEYVDSDEYGFMFLRDGEEMNDMEHLGSWNMGLTYGIGIEDD